MGKDNYNFECPFGECYEIVCNLNGIKNGQIECPIQLRRKCETDVQPDDDDKILIKKTWNRLRLKSNLERYKKMNPLYYPTVPPLQTKCPINYDWSNCSSSEYEMKCRTCCNYNPLRMLYEKTANRVDIVVPEEVLLEDCKVQLEKGHI